MTILKHEDAAFVLDGKKTGAAASEVVLRKIIALISVCVLSFIAQPLHAAEFSDGVAAVERGDYATGFAIFRELAEQGDAEAQHNLGVFYASGQGVPQDFEEAVRWWRLAAEQGDAEAQHNLGVSYASGQGVPEDKQEAARWYRLAADQGNAEAQFKLGLMYGTGEGVLQSYEEALRWWRLAADQGHANAQAALDLFGAAE